MILSPREGHRHSYRSIHPHKAVRQVAVGPPRRGALQMQDGGHIPVAVLLRGRLCSPEGGICRTQGGLGRPGSPFWGVRGCPPRGDCVACWWRAIRTGVVCVPVGAWAGGPGGVPADGWVSVCRPLWRPRWRLRGGFSCVI